MTIVVDNVGIVGFILYYVKLNHFMHHSMEDSASGLWELIPVQIHVVHVDVYWFPFTFPDSIVLSSQYIDQEDCVDFSLAGECVVAPQVFHSSATHLLQPV